MKAKYAEIYEDLKEKIESGTYPKDSYLPSEHTLISAYDCSRNTVRRAISALASEGYLQSMHGKGVLVIWQPPQQSLFSLSGIESLQEAAKRNDMSYRTKVVHFAELTIDERLSKRTGFAVGEEVYYIQRVRYFDDEAYILDHNWFLKSVLPGLTKKIAEQSIYEYMEKKLGVTIATTSRKMTVEPMTQVDEKYLDMKGYNCLAVVTSQTYTGSGVMFEYTVSRHRPDKFVFYTTARR
ncbi:MAG: trehalose operon repressor [Lachnospiraceae bacterium]|nr:trehalose operon repressor [Lachnospiraceae bacterium]